jgi:thiol-disulfide isomerase/thioredoxin
MKKNSVFLLGVALVFTAFGAYIAQRHTEPAAADNSATSQLLAQTFNDTSGQPQALAQWKGNALIVNFWATWCAPCVDEMPELSALQNEISPVNIQIIGIGIDSPANIAEFARKYNIAYPLYTGGMNASELSRLLGNKAGGLPFTVLIGRDGQVKKSYLGRLKMDQLRKDLTAL